jgi:hypothetical protein
MRKEWLESEREVVRKMYGASSESGVIAQALNRSVGSVEKQIHIERCAGLRRHPVSESETQVWDDWLKLEGDALILPDVEAPYHHAEFINRCIDLADAFGIRRLVLSGDFVHFANFSQWGADFSKKGMSAAKDQKLIDIVMGLPQEQRERMFQELERAEIINPEKNISEELSSVRKLVREIENAFGEIVYFMGNHERRKLTWQGYSEGPEELVRLFEGKAEKWKASPYYFCELNTEGGLYRIEHPGGAGVEMARQLCVQYHCSVMMGHSHRWEHRRDPSGDFHAIQMGHCVDEKRRLQYVAQRSKRRDAHALGAVIVLDGYPILLEADSPWERLKKM